MTESAAVPPLPLSVWLRNWLHYSSAGLSIPHLQQMDLTWVIGKQHFEIYEYPLWLDELILKTWAQHPKGLMCLRDFEYTYAEGGKKTSIDAAFAEKKETSQNSSPPCLKSEDGLKPCMRSTSCWLILNTVTGRLVKPDEKTLGTLTFNDDAMPGDSLIKIELCESWDIEELCTLDSFVYERALLPRKTVTCTRHKLYVVGRLRRKTYMPL